MTGVGGCHTEMLTMHPDQGQELEVCQGQNRCGRKSRREKEVKFRDDDLSSVIQRWSALE